MSLLVNAPNQSDVAWTIEDPVSLRDRLVRTAAAQFYKGEIAEGVATLAELEFATIDEVTLQATDLYLSHVTRGKKLIATCDPLRIPAEDEIVIIYGNYPHIFGNVIVNNPIRRHVATFGEFSYDAVEFDSRWDAVGQIYIINADHRPDRYDSILRELATARAPLHRITRIRASQSNVAQTHEINGHIGCLESHIDALKHAARTDFDHILILEDDFCFTSDIQAHLDGLSSFFLRGYDYLICLLGTSKYGKTVPLDDLICQSQQQCTNTEAYLVSRDGLPRLLQVQEFALQALKETLDAGKYAADRAWSVLQETGKFLVFRKKFGFQNSNFSDIERRITRFLD